MRPPRDPTRRNREQGTKKRGRGQNNRLVIPDRRRDPRVVWAQLGPHRTAERLVHGRRFLFFVEPTQGGCFHPCSVDDVTAVLEAMPAVDLSGLGAVVLRQPTSKQRILSPAWGRLLFAIEQGPYEGPAVLLEAQALGAAIRWGRALDPDGARELERLREDGHAFTPDRRGHSVRVTYDSARATLLFRTLLHEIGHWVDFRAYGDDTDAFFARPAAEREAFAHRFADEAARRLREAGRVPFERRLDPASLRADGLRIEDFMPPRSPPRGPTSSDLA